jgi:hypothetical protein
LIPYQAPTLLDAWTKLGAKRVEEEDPRDEPSGSRSQLVRAEEDEDDHAELPRDEILEFSNRKDITEAESSESKHHDGDETNSNDEGSGREDEIVEDRNRNKVIEADESSESEDHDKDETNGSDEGLGREASLHMDLGPQYSDLSEDGSEADVDTREGDPVEGGRSEADVNQNVRFSDDNIKKLGEEIAKNLVIKKEDQDAEKKTRW